MTDDALRKEPKFDIQWYEDEIRVRGCEFTLPQIKATYRELTALANREGERLVGSLKRPDDMTEEAFGERNALLRDDAFRLTVSIIGFDNQTTYGETEDIFDSKNLPLPIKTVFFTNSNSFKRHSGGAEPPNRFSIWLHFDKPPLFDPNPLVSEPTLNFSKVALTADDVTFYRAVQNIISTRLSSNRKWYSFIHEKFAYDVGLWIIALPYALYWITVYADYLFPSDGRNASFRVAFFIYGLGLSLFAYRALFGYLKWAFPVNILEENKDRATRHRVALGGIVFSLIVSGTKSVLGTFANF